MPAYPLTDELAQSTQISYASDELSRLSQYIIGILEQLTGQQRLSAMYADYRERRRPPELFWADAIEALRLELELNQRPWECVPATGPLVVLANHPFGIVDGIVLGWIVSQCRSDFQIMTHNVLYRAPEIRHRILPVDFTDNPDAKANNLRSRNLAKALLEKGGALVVFPGGGVATAPKLSSQAKERPWGPLAAKLALATGAAVLPVFFHGQNSRLFQIASNIHPSGS